MNIVAAVLAAGASRRLGRPKQLVLYRGVTLVQRALDATSLDAISSRAVVLGANAERISGVLPPHVVRLDNDAWAEGMASSIRVAVDWAQRGAADALALLLVDQPLIDATHTQRLIDAWHGGEVPAAATFYAGAPGAPAIFSSSMFADLLALRGDRGAGALLRARNDIASVPCDAASTDIDTETELAALESHDT